MSTEISSTVVQNRDADRMDSTSKVVQLSSVKNFMRLSEARLQAVLSKNMYSEQGLLARISPSSGQVCHSFIVS